MIRLVRFVLVQREIIAIYGRGYSTEFGVRYLVVLLYYGVNFITETSACVFCIKYSFHDVPVRVNQPKLAQGIAIKEFSEFLVNQKYAFCIKYLCFNVPVRVKRSELVQGNAMKELSEFLVNQKYVFWMKYSFHHVPFRIEQSKLVQGIAMKGF